MEEDDGNEKQELSEVPTNVGPKQDLQSPTKKAKSDDASEKTTKKRQSTSGAANKNKKKRVMELEEQEKTISTFLQKLKQNRTKLRAKLRIAETTKYPIRDDLVANESSPLPQAVTKVDCPNELQDDIMFCWSFLVLFKKQLSLSSLSLDDFVELCKYCERTSVAINEIFTALLRVIINDSSLISKVMGSINSKLHFSSRIKGSQNSSTVKVQAIGDDLFDDQDLDASFNGFRILPHRIKADMLEGYRWPCILRCIFLKLERVKQLRTAAIDFELVARNLQLNSESGTAQRNFDRDAVLQVTSDNVTAYQRCLQLSKMLGFMEIHEFPIEDKVMLMKILCQTCLDTKEMRELIEKNSETRNQKLIALKKEMKEEKAKAKDASTQLREAAIAACKKKMEAKAASSKTLKKDKAKGKDSNANTSKPTKEKSTEPTKEQIEKMIEELRVLEHFEIDEVVDEVEIEDDDDEEEDDKANSKTSRTWELNRQKRESERIKRLEAIQEATDYLKSVLENAQNEQPSERDLKSAIKTAVRAGLRWDKDVEKEDEDGEMEEVTVTYCTQLLKDAYMLQYELDMKIKEDRMSSDFEKALREFPTSIECIGYDRNFREYYIFPDDDRLYIRFLDSSDAPNSSSLSSKQVGFISRIPADGDVQLHDKSLHALMTNRPSKHVFQWSYYGSQQDIYELIQSLNERGEREYNLKNAIRSCLDVQEPEDYYQRDGSPYIGRKVRRVFEKPKRMVVGSIVGWFPAENEGDMVLWRVLHSDGDEEDLEEYEVLENLLDENGRLVKHKDKPRKEKASSSRRFDENEEAEYESEASDDESSEDEVQEPSVVRSYVNRFRNLGKDASLGVNGLRAEVMEALQLMVDPCKRKGSPALNKENRKLLEQSIRSMEKVSEIKQMLLEFEEIIHSVQTSEDIKDEDDIAKEKELNKQAMAEEGWLFSPESHEFVGRRARRFFKDFGRSDGTVVAYLPAEKNEGNALWHMEHDDGDEEDIEENDTDKAIKYFEEDLSHGDFVDDDEDGSDDDVEEDDDDDDEDDNEDSARLWPTSGVRSRWVEAVTSSETIPELSLAFLGFRQHCKTFGLLATEEKSSANRKASVSSGRKTSSRLSRFPSRHAARNVKSYAE